MTIFSDQKKSGSTGQWRPVDGFFFGVDHGAPDPTKHSKDDRFITTGFTGERVDGIHRDVPERPAEVQQHAAHEVGSVALPEAVPLVAEAYRAAGEHEAQYGSNGA